ncbi:MAG: helix-turn-helix transcriptional regulator [Rubrobacter sp.]|nr:helix-turn-helix transcriptional regulator [Rubrobacter sp.]
MCGRTAMFSGPRNGARRRGGEFFGLEVEEMSPRGQVAAAVSVLAPVLLSGVLLLVFLPGVWWVFTTYFWVAFPALGLLSRGLAGSGAERRAALTAAEDPERELLSALRRHEELTAARAAVETSLSVAEADRRLGELAGAGHLTLRVRDGGIFYALWDPPAARRETNDAASERGLRERSSLRPPGPAGTRGNGGSGRGGVR